MPIETQEAVNWALQQTFDDGFGNQIQVTKEMPSVVVDKVREYFNQNNIEYSTFSFDDLIPFLN